jgi:molybdate transport system permease protein
MFGHAVALRAEALDGERDGGVRHRRDEAGSVSKGQPSLGAGNGNHTATSSALRAREPHDMVPRMLTAHELQILATSLGVAGRAVLFSLPVAIAFAWALSRPKFPGKWIVDAVAHLPLVLPPVLVGYFLLLLFGVRGPVGRWLHDVFGIQLAFTVEGAALATAVMAFPLMVRAIRLSFEATDRGLFEAAAVLRAGPWDRFWSMALPLAWPGVLAGAVTAFAAGLGEFGAVITFASNVEGQTQTLPLAIYSALQVPNGEDAALRLAGISMTAAVVGLVLAEMLQRWARRRLEA